MAYRDFKGLPKRTASDKVLYDKAFDIAKNLKYRGYQRDLAAMVCKNFDKKTQQLAKYYTKQLLENLKNEKYTHL